MAIVISMVSPKGGVGKTTAAVVLATELAQSGKPITIIDADPNTPVVTWSKQPDKPANITVIADQSEETTLANITRASKNSSVVIVDLEGTANMRVSYAISRSDLVVIPCKPSMLDAHEVAKAVSLINRTQDMTGIKIPYCVLFSQMPAALRTRNFGDISRQFTELAIPVLPVQLIEREAFRSIFSFGGSIHTLSPKEVSGLPAARQNSLALTTAVIRQINSSKKSTSSKHETAEPA